MFFAQGLVPKVEEVQPLRLDPYGQWVWISSIDVSAEEIRPKDSSEFVLTLTPEGRLTSTTDCNTVSGSYIQNENALSIGALVSTEKSCRGKSFESSYISQLNLVASFEITDNTLTLYLANSSGEMTFFRR
jgi:heat shock protein HslJ